MEPRRHELETDEERENAVAEPLVEADAPQRVAARIGNAAFGQAVGQMGSGILPDGTAHPDVQETIARTRGGGTGLDGRTREQASDVLGDSLADVRVHTDATADALATSVAARAFTVGNDVYFAQGEHRPGTSDGDRLLTHELAHVVQQRGAPTSGPLQVSQPGDALEAEADEASGGIA